MPTNRRCFLQSAAAVSATLLLGRGARAQSAGLPLVITIEAAGAWDPTFLCDPVGGASQVTPFASSAIRTAGNLRYAPRRLPGESTTVPELYAFNGENFFVRWRDGLTIFNGVDNETVSHDVGPRVAFAGTNREGHPVLASLAAATSVSSSGSAPPLAFITTGGHAETAGLIVTTRAGGASTLLSLARPNSSRPNDPTAAQQYHVSDAESALRDYRRARDARLKGSVNAPRLRAFIEGVVSARSEDADARFDALGDAFAQAQSASGGGLIRHLSAVLGAMKNDACVAAHVDRGGFDTHGDHDDAADGHRPRLASLLDGLDFIGREVEGSATLRERGVVVVVGSDFGRTFYNGTSATRGKDHWPITSMMVMALGSAQAILGGNRTVGATFIGSGKGMNARNVRVVGGEVVSGSEGRRLTPALVHQSLRAKLGIDRTLQQRFSLPNLPATPFPFFG
jgi:hypothetical protein